MSLDIQTEKPQILSGDISEAHLRAALRTGTAAIDIETSGLEWAKHAIATCQVYVPGTGCVIVVNPSPEPQRLLQLLSLQAIQKVFHHAMFDLRFMSHRWGAQFSNVACTKIASKLLDPSRKSHSLKPLLSDHLGVEIDKSLQVSDWTAKTLSDEQLAYAVSDVVHLPLLLHALTSRLDDAGLLPLYYRCLDHLPARVELDLKGYTDVYMY